MVAHSGSDGQPARDPMNRKVTSGSGPIYEQDAFTGKGSFWIAQPKKASGEKSDRSQNIVRQLDLTPGLEDQKVCTTDGTRSGSCFTPRER